MASHESNVSGISKTSHKKNGASILGGKDPLPWYSAKQMCLLTAKHDKRFALLFTIGIYSGLRISDLVKVTRTDLRNKYIKLKAEKTGKTELRWFPPSMYDLLRLSKISISGLKTGCLFGSVKTPEKPMTSDSIAIALKKYCLMAGIPDHLDIATHTLRKTFARRLYDKSFDKSEALRKISTLFNHENEAETRRYIGVMKEEIKAMVLNIDSDTYDDRAESLHHNLITYESIEEMISKAVAKLKI